MHDVKARQSGHHISMHSEVGCDCRGAGSSLLLKPNRIEKIVRSMSGLLSVPLTIKASPSSRSSVQPLPCVALLPALPRLTSRQPECIHPHSVHAVRGAAVVVPGAASNARGQEVSFDSIERVMFVAGGVGEGWRALRRCAKGITMAATARTPGCLGRPSGAL